MSAAANPVLGFVVQRRIPFGFLFGVLFALTMRPTWAHWLAGLPLVLAGLALRTLASGFIRKNKALAVQGLYRLCRNPLYFGSFVMTVGFCVMGGRWIYVVMGPALFLLVYHHLILGEESHLLKLFGNEWHEYRAQVPRFFPRSLPVGAIVADMRGAFEWKLVMKHHEYEAWAGAAALSLLMAAVIHYDFHLIG